MPHLYNERHDAPFIHAVLIRLVSGTGTLMLLAGLAWLLAGRTDAPVAAAADLRGERWYRLMLDDRHVGYLHTATRRDAVGRWRFESDLRFVLAAGQPVATREVLVFGAMPPYPLLEGSQTSERPEGRDGTRIDHSRPGYRVSRLGGVSRLLDLKYDLADHLEFETWLRGTAPPPGATRTIRALDFDRRRVVSRQFRVVERNATGYRLENTAPLDTTRIQLDGRLRPVTMTLSGLFGLELASRAEALAPGTALQARSYYVPADRPLPQHTEIRSLELQVEGAVAAAELWPELIQGDALRRTAGTVNTPRLLGDELAETADHPTTDPRIRALAREAVAGSAGEHARVEALVGFVNGYLRYAEDGARRHVLALLDEPVGDCSEYAELLTTLARAVDIPSRTVFGLAYAADGPPAFRFHAWNELLADGEWRAVDPTWNQLRTDATHIPMPANAAHALDLLTGGLDLRFNIRNVDYF